MVDVCDRLAFLVRQRGTDHDEDHRTAAAGLFVDLLHVRAQRDRIAGPDWSDEFDVLARVEAGLAEARHMLEEMVAVAEGDREGGRRDETVMWSLLGGLRIDVVWIGIADRIGKLANHLRIDRDGIGGFEDSPDNRGIVVYGHRATLPRRRLHAARVCAAA